MIKESDLALVADRRPGRPPKAAAEGIDAGDQVEVDTEEIEEKPAKKRRGKKARKGIDIQDISQGIDEGKR
jgi:hypothetical protein